MTKEDSYKSYSIVKLSFVASKFVIKNIQPVVAIGLLSMKVQLMLILLCCFCFIVGCVKKENFALQHFSNLSTLAEAVGKVADELFSQYSTSTNVVIANGYKVSDFTNEFILKISNNLFTYFHLVTTAGIKELKGKQWRSNVFVIRDLSDLQEFYKSIRPEIFIFNGYFLVVLVCKDIVNIQSIFELFWKLEIYMVNVIYENDNGAIIVKTFMPLSRRSCNDTTPVVINEFINGTFSKPIDSEFFPRKMRNLNKCPIRVSIANNSEPNIFAKIQPNGSYQLSGRDIHLINALAQSMNFSINYTYIGDDGYFLDNGTGQGTLKAVLNGTADLSITDWFLTASRLKFFGATSSYISGLIVFIVFGGRELSTFEKLIFPFDFLLWALIVMCFIVGYIIIGFVKTRSMRMQNLLFGDDVKNPYLNMFVGFIGGAQNILPTGNCARIILMAFLMYSMVIRTIYQGSFFDLMQSKRHHKEVQSIDEMVRMDYKIYLHPGIADFFQGTEILRKRY